MALFDAHSPIGIFDSGIGGLSVLRHIRTELPGEELCYFADSGFAPYGDKSEDEILRRTLVGARELIEHGVKAIVVACNTATAAAIAMLRSHYPQLIIVGVEPGLKPAVMLTKTGTVAVLATSSTLASSRYKLLSEQIQKNSAVNFIHQACPGLVDQIERGELKSPATIALLESYLAPILQSDADTIVLGCTHYPFVEACINEIVLANNKQTLQIVDTGSAIAKQLRRLLSQGQLLNPSATNTRLLCSTTGSVSQLEIALVQLLQLGPHQFSCREIGCKTTTS